MSSPGAPWREAAVAQVHEWAAGLRTVRLDLDLPPFEAGQFVRLGLPAGPGQEPVARSYSMASAPGAPAEFFLVLVEDGALTPRLLALEPGERLWVDPRPAGVFTLSRVPAAPTLWLVATGTGLGPYVSMLRTAEPWDRFERLILVHGVRRAEHLAYQGELARRSAEHGGKLRYVPVVSREPGPEGSLQGRVTNLLASGALEARAGEPLAAERSHVLLCGNPAMIDEVRALLEARGLRRNRPRTPGQITFERYW